MNLNTKASDNFAILTTLDPVSQSTGANTTVWVSAANFSNFVAIIQTGVLGTAATVAAKIQQATDSSGTLAKDITGKAITNLVKASNDNDQVMINFRADDLDVPGGFSYVGMVVTVGAAASIVGGVLLGFGPRYAPPVDAAAPIAINLGAATVVQIV